MDVLVRLEGDGVTVEYLNPSFLVKKPNEGACPVTVFGEVGQFTEPHPSLMPGIESGLQNV